MISDIYAPLHPDTIADPYPVFRRLQEEAPVVWHEGLFAWVLSRYDDCKLVLGSPTEFSRNPAKLLGVRGPSIEAVSYTHLTLPTIYSV